MVKGDKREPSDEVSFRLRMTERQRAAIANVAEESGRSITAEIIHRLEDYDQMRRAYSVMTTDDEFQIVAVRLARLRQRVTSAFEQSGDDGTLANAAFRFAALAFFERLELTRKVAGKSVPDSFRRAFEMIGSIEAADALSPIEQAGHWNTMLEGEKDPTVREVLEGIISNIEKAAK